MDKLKKLKAVYQDCVDKMQVILDGADSALTDEQQAEFDSLKAKAESTKTQIANYEELLKSQAEADRLANAPAPSLGRQVRPDSVILDNPINGPVKHEVAKVPAKAKRWAGNLQSFRGPDADLRAYKAGMWLAATLCGNPYARKFCQQHGISTERVEFDRSQIEALHQGGRSIDG